MMVGLLLAPWASERTAPPASPAASCVLYSGVGGGFVLCCPGHPLIRKESGAEQGDTYQLVTAIGLPCTRRKRDTAAFTRTSRSSSFDLLKSPCFP